MTECPIWNYTTSEPGTLHQISVLPSSPVTITKGSTTQGIVKTSTESLTTSVYTKTSAIKPQTKSLVTTPKISQTTIRLTTKYLITKTTTSVTKTDVTKYTGDPGIIGTSSFNYLTTIDTTSDFVEGFSCTRDSLLPN